MWPCICANVCTNELYSTIPYNMYATTHGRIYMHRGSCGTLLDTVNVLDSTLTQFKLIGIQSLTMNIPL